MAPDDRARPAIEGYCDQLSYVAGDRVHVHCSTELPEFSAEVSRFGLTRQLVWRGEGLSGRSHPVPEDAYANGCRWPATFSLEIGDDWRSGFYEIALRPDGNGRPGHAFFAVRPSASTARAPILLVLSTNTYNAYNCFGGECLYTGAHQVSFDRPLEPGYIVKPIDGDGFDGRFASTEHQGDPEHRRLAAYLDRTGLPMWTSSAGWWNWERRFTRWAEASGYQLDVAVNGDLERYPDVLDGHRLMVSVGHDEYWSWAMRDTVDAFVERGGNVAFLGGNTMLWQVRLEDSGRTMVCYKGGARAHDPTMGGEDRSRLTSCWSDPLIGRPENLTTGLSFWRGGYVRIGWAAPRSSGAYTVHQPEHWVFAGTGLRYGDQLGSESMPVGYETDGCAMTLADGLPVPTGEDGTPLHFEVLGTAPARLISISDSGCEAPPRFWASLDPPGDLEFAADVVLGSPSSENIRRLSYNHAVMGAFSRGGTVFNAGSADWAYGLDDDPLVQRVTANVLDRLSGSP